MGVKPKDYEVKEPGDLVQVYTLDVRPVAGERIKGLDIGENVDWLNGEVAHETTPE